MINSSPCYECTFKDEDKRNERCENCPDRLAYAAEQGMIPQEILNKEEDPVIEEARQSALAKREKPICKTAECINESVVKGFCNSCYQKDYHQRNLEMVTEKKAEKHSIAPIDVVKALFPLNKKKQKTCKCGRSSCKGKIKAHGLCDNAYARWKSKNPDKLRHYSKESKGEKVKYAEVRLQGNIDKQPERYELLQKCKELAALKFRSVNQQVFFFIQEGLEREKAKDQDNETETETHEAQICQNR